MSSTFCANAYAIHTCAIVYLDQYPALIRISKICLYGEKYVYMLKYENIQIAKYLVKALNYRKGLLHEC